MSEAASQRWISKWLDCAGTSFPPRGWLATALALTVVARASTNYALELSENAALQYWMAFAFCPEETEKISAATSDDEKIGFGVPVSQALAKNFRGSGERALEFLHRGAELSSCEWGTDLRKYGPRDADIHGQKAHELARISLLRARWRFEHGDWDTGIDDVVATMILGRHIGRDKYCVNVHFGCMLEGMATGTTAVYLPRMPEQARSRLAAKLDALPPPTSMREVILYHENQIDWGIDRFKQAENEGKLFELVASLSSKEEAKKILQLAGNAEGLIRLAQAGRSLARQLADAVSLPPDEYDRVYKDRFTPLLEANPVAAILGSWYEEARDEEATAHCRLVFLVTAIDVLRRGKGVLKDHPDPYGDGPFEYTAFDGGFELRSKLVYHLVHLQIRQDFGLRKK